MARAKKGFKARRRRNRALKQARGFRGGRSKLWRSAVEAVRRAWAYAYAHRRRKKRDFRRLWITRIGAAVRPHGISYSRFIAGLKHADIEIDRRMLSELAISEPETFARIVSVAKG